MDNDATIKTITTTTTITKEHAKRNYMKQCEKYRETNNARYAMKHIKVEYYESSLEKNDSDAYVQAACDLTLEAEILSNLAHPNIIKLRGMTHSGVAGFANGPNGYFLIMDRLFETLDQRMIRLWKREDNILDVNSDDDDDDDDDDDVAVDHPSKKGRKSSSSSFVVDDGGGGGDRVRQGRVATAAVVELQQQQRLDVGDGQQQQLDLKNELMDEQLNIALQISAAVMYLHSNSIIFRDLKPANIGFDVRGDVKIFDFGLARIMPQNGRHYDDAFKMSGAGSPRYMAPECLCSEPYNMKADVYSFAILFWEMLAGGETPYAFARTLNELADHVVNEQGRPRIHEEWPVNIQRMLECSFDDDMGLRPEMKSVHHDIKTALVALRGGNSTGLSHRSIVRRRSTESFANLNQLMVASSKEDSLCAAMSRSSHRCVPIPLVRNSKSMMVSRQNNTSSDGLCDKSQFSLGRLPLQDSHKSSAQSSSHLLRRQRLSRQHASWDRMQEELAKRNAEQSCMLQVVSPSKQNAMWNTVNQESTSQGPPSLETSMLSAVESSLSSPSIQSPINVAARNDLLDRITLHRSSSSQHPAKNAPVVRLRRNYAIGRTSLQDLTASYPTNSSMQRRNSFHPSVQIKEEEAWDNFVETDDDAEREMLICRNNLGSVLRRNPASFCH